MQSPADQQRSVKAIYTNRARIKERIQEKHRQQSHHIRQGRLSGLREGEDAAPSGGRGDAALDEEQRQTGPSPTTWYPPACSSSPSSAQPSVCFHADGSLVLPAVEDWTDIGNEFGVDLSDAGVMECLLAIEEEIRQEQLFQLYDQANGNEWEDYYNSLTS